MILLWIFLGAIYCIGLGSSLFLSFWMNSVVENGDIGWIGLRRYGLSFVWPIYLTCILIHDIFVLFVLDRHV